VVDYCLIDIVPLKGLCHHMDNFFYRSIKINRYFRYMRQWFLNILLGLLRKISNTKILIASTKIFTSSETCTVSRIKILLRITIYDLCHWSIFSMWSPLIGHGKSRVKYTSHGQFTEQFLESQPGSGASFTVTGGYLNAATSSLKRVTGRILKIRKCF
jgi:hypothetical protein